MKAPIIVDENGSVDAFQTVESAERYLEAIDIKNEEYQIYDSEGRLLKGEFSDLWGPVTLRAVEDEPSHQAELIEALRQSLEHRGEDPNWLAQASLGELVERIASKYPTV